jgi:small-conductance mechanosensitive channel
MRGLRIALAALCALVISLSAALAFDQALLGQSDRALQEFRAGLDRMEELLRRPALTEKELLEARSALETLRTSAAERSMTLSAPLAEVNQQIASLGAPPAQGASEDAGVAKARADLNATRDRLQSLKSQFDVIAVEAEQSAGRVAAQQRDQFFERVFDRRRSILNPSLWYDTAVGSGVLLSGLGLLFKNWWAEVGPKGDPIGLLLVPLFIVIFVGGYGFIRRWAKHWMERYASRSRSIDDMSRLWRIVRGLITTAVALAILFVPIRLALDASGYFTPRLLMVWMAVVTTLSGTIFFFVLARRVASPTEPQWRVIDLDDRAASRFTLLAGAIALVASLNTQLSKLAEALYLSVSYTVGQSALFALLLLSMLSLMLLVVKNQDGLANKAGRRIYFEWVASLTPFIWVLIILGFGALLAGYVALADYIAHQMVRTAMVLGVLFILYHLFDAAISASFDPQSGFGMFLRRITGLGERGIERLGLVVRTGVDLILLIAGIPLLVLLWTLTWVDFGGFYNTLALGVKVGEITISPAIVLMMLAVLAIGVIATKLFNRWLARRILSDTRINRGVQDSILKGSTYVGYFLAAAFALTITGIDFSNLALIAGALGIGIGLGLQSIVNNFVSGLIILAERPIRVGDWVSLPSGEGIVRRINVRSTEIETFDSCSIILPNSALVTEPVRNWTHKDNMGRILVAVTVEYDSDAEQVRSLLLETARGHAKVLSTPEPIVSLARFSPAGLDFELRAFVADILEGAGVASDIRFLLVGQFREKGITFAHPLGVMQAPKP